MAIEQNPFQEGRQKFGRAWRSRRFTHAVVNKLSLEMDGPQVNGSSHPDFIEARSIIDHGIHALYRDIEEAGNPEEIAHADGQLKAMQAVLSGEIKADHGTIFLPPSTEKSADLDDLPF